MFRYFIQLAYNGSNFHGWQIQPNADTVQERLNMAVSMLLSEKINVTGAGRTDTGVHASFFVAHFDVETAIENTDVFVYKLNQILLADIRVDNVFRVDNEMHSRFNALSRTYHYFFSYEKEPFVDNFSVFIPSRLDVEKMNKAAAVMFNHSDFTSFSKLHTDVKTNNCNVYKAHWRLNNEMLIFEIEADRFLRNMVRAIVGSLIMVGRGKISIADFEQIILEKDRGKAGASVKAKGLFLTDISYPETVSKHFRIKPFVPCL
ncbi:MAG: tRNA pseudouridine(38-40) synthase TruA [Prolixibacteraceae bacterium]|jgi:tRNA pseudouridine38-40 synthase|nr:tRNA pseudouridine(38-40) synthase TruA [Prolixibacteraceae bacterium]